MRRGNRSFSLLYGYVAREFLLSFCISFLFFFFIFFVNQILVLAREILLKNVSIRMVLYLVVLTIPQFLLYTFPFSSLTAASMTIGGLSSTNEIMAIRFSGMNIKRVFIPIAAVSLVISFAAILISNNLIPYTSSKYKEQYTKILRDIPTIELESGKVSQIDDLVLSNGDVEGNQVNDITLFDISRTGSVNSITAEKGRISLIDLQNFVYELSLDKPMVLSNKSSSMTDWGVASASSMTLYLDFSNRIPAVQSLTPSQMSLAELKELAARKNKERQESQLGISVSGSQNAQRLSDGLHAVLGGSAAKLSASDFERLGADAAKNAGTKSIDFYYQYYRSEFNKKLALSMACTFLVFIAFPISFIKVRYGRLIGFALSIFISVAYWFMLFFMQLKSVQSAMNPVSLIWLPNMLFFTIGSVLVWRLGKR